MPMITVSLQTFRSLNRRARKACQRKAISQWKRRLGTSDNQPTIRPNETRDELLERGRELIENLRSKRQRLVAARIRQSERDQHVTHRETVNLLETVAVLRTNAITRLKADSRDRAFYVSIRNGERYGLLYGPLGSQAAALRAKPFVRQVANEINAGDSAFAAFGTCSVPLAEAKPGILNSHISGDITAYLARWGYDVLSQQAA